MRSTEKFYTYYKPEPVYLALEDLPDVEFMWNETEIKHFEKLWNMDVPLVDIAIQMDKSDTSIFLLVMDRCLKGLIKPRNGWKIW